MKNLERIVITIADEFVEGFVEVVLNIFFDVFLDAL